MCMHWIAIVIRILSHTDTHTAVYTHRHNIRGIFFSSFLILKIDLNSSRLWIVIIIHPSSHIITATKRWTLFHYTQAMYVTLSVLWCPRAHQQHHHKSHANVKQTLWYGFACGIFFSSDFLSQEYGYSSDGGCRWVWVWYMSFSSASSLRNYICKSCFCSSIPCMWNMHIFHTLNELDAQLLS